MATNLVFYYFGDDEAYFRALHGEFKKSTRLSLEFKRIYETEETKIQALFLKVFKLKPACVFIDFSKLEQDYLHLARLISRTPLEHTVTMVGLLDYLSPPEVLKECIATGVNLAFIKSAEIFDVVFDVTKLISPAEVGEHGFATADLKDDWDAGIPCKVGYVHSEGLHIETDMTLTKGSHIKLKHHWLEKKVVPSKSVFVKETSNIDLFYQYKNNADLDFQFVDEYLPAEGVDPKEVKEKTAEREDSVRFHKKQLGKWIEDNLSRSQEKKAKVLVVDRDFHFYQSHSRTDKHSYNIRCIPFFNDIALEMDRLHPQVIAIAQEEDGPDAKNTQEMIQKLTETIKIKYAALEPMIIIFNSSVPSKELQEITGYQKLMSQTNELSVEVLERMAEIFEKKMGQNNVVGLKDNRKKVFLKKSQLSSIAEIMTQITVIKLSEADMIFQSTQVFPIGTSIHISKPVDMYINIQPAKTQGKTPEYYGLIHCIGESDKKELRRYVNSVFFREHDATKGAETEEFKKLNEAKMNEKLALIKKAEEAKAAELATEAADKANKNAAPAAAVEKPKEPTSA